MNDLITLRDGTSTATIAPLGAELQSWLVAGQDLLWRPDARWWDQTSPILFPVCGWLRDGVIRVDGKTYPLGLHGFAARSAFTVIETAPDAATLELRDDAATRALFPFAFRLRVEYRLRGNAIETCFTVANPAATILPYALGLHPGFRWPFAGGDRAAYHLEFEREERREIPVHENGLITTRTRPLPIVGRTLPLSDALFASGGLNMREAASRSVAFRAPDGAAIHVGFEALPNIMIWMRPGAPFLCIEGWQGTNDPQGFAGDIMEKPGMAMLDPGAEAAHAVTMRFEA